MFDTIFCQLYRASGRPLTDSKAVSMWLALDDANMENGGMNMYKFTSMPDSRDNNLPMRDIEGVDDTKEQFGTFFQGERN